LQNRTDKTREKLMLSGMELYARFGIEGVSLRAVNEHAGSKNNSAAHYHFKTKDNFIEHIISYMFALDDDEITAFTSEFDGVFTGVEQAVFEYITPLLFIYEEREWGRFGLKFLAVLLISQQSRNIDLWTEEMIEAGESFIKQLDGLIPNTAQDELRLRASFMVINFIVGLAGEDSIENTVFGNLSAPSQEHQLKQLMSLISYCAAGLSGGIQQKK